jgi:hypothetical protein
MGSPDSSLEKDCSTACTNAAVSALLFASIAIGLSRYPEAVDKLMALGEFVTTVVSAASALERLDHDSCWRALRQTVQADAPSVEESWSLKRLAELNCGDIALPQPPRGTKVQPTPPTVTNAGKSSISADLGGPSRPSAPRPAGKPHLIAPLEPAVDLYNAMVTISDQALLSRARDVSNRTNIALYGWQVLRANLINDVCAERRAFLWS